MIKATILSKIPEDDKSAKDFSVLEYDSSDENYTCFIFDKKNGSQWAGKFFNGDSEYSHAEVIKDSSIAIVVAKGQGYIVDIESENLIRYTDEDCISDLIRCSDRPLLFFADDTYVFEVDKKGEQTLVELGFTFKEIKFKGITGDILKVEYISWEDKKLRAELDIRNLDYEEYFEEPEHYPHLFLISQKETFKFLVLAIILFLSGIPFFFTDIYMISGVLMVAAFILFFYWYDRSNDKEVKLKLAPQGIWTIQKGYLNWKKVKDIRFEKQGRKTIMIIDFLHYGKQQVQIPIHLLERATQIPGIIDRLRKD